MKGNDEKHKKAVPLRAMFVVSALLAELMVAISSKGHGEGVVSDTSVDDSAIAIAADLIVRQPKAVQDQLIGYMGEFLGRQDVLALGNKEATQTLRQQVEAMRKNPWALLASPPPVSQPDMPAWQAKLSARETNAPSPQLSA